MGLAKLDDRAQHGEEGKEQRHLDQRGDAAAKHVDAVILLQLHDLDVHLVALGIGRFVLLVTFFDGVHLGLNALHLETALHGLDAERKNGEIDEDGEKDDGPTPGSRPTDDGGVDELEGEEEIFADGAEEAEVEQRLERNGVAGSVDGAEYVDG